MSPAHDRRVRFRGGTRSVRRSRRPQGPSRAWAVLVNGLGNPLFTGAAFSKYQNRAFGGCHSSDGLIHLYDGGTFPDKVPGWLCARAFLVLLGPVPESSLRQCPGDSFSELLQVHGLRNKIERAFMNCLNG